MKINLIDQNTHRPYANRAVLIQLKDENSGQITSTLTLRSSQEGILTLDQKYEGYQLSVSINGTRSAWVKAADNIKLEVQAPETQSQNQAQQNNILKQDNKQAPQQGNQPKKDTQPNKTPQQGAPTKRQEKTS